MRLLLGSFAVVTALSMAGRPFFPSQLSVIEVIVAENLLTIFRSSECIMLSWGRILVLIGFLGVKEGDMKLKSLPVGVFGAV